MRFASGPPLGLLLLAATIAGCSHSPTGADSPVPIATGAQILRITVMPQCTGDVRILAPLIYTRVNVTRGSSEWIATASSPAAGDVELRFHQSDTLILNGSMRVAGTIRGTAVHAPDLLPGIPTQNVRVNFGTDGRTQVSGFAFSASSLTPVAGIDGVGNGSLTISDDAAHTCTASSFSWSVASPG